MVARRTKSGGAAPGPRHGGSGYRANRVGCSAAGSEVVHEEGSSLRASEASDHTRAAVRSEMSREEVPDGGGVPASTRNFARSFAAGSAILAEAQSLTKVSGGGGMFRNQRWMSQERCSVKERWKRRREELREDEVGCR